MWSYSGDPSTSAKDLARYRIGDIDHRSQWLEDEEILYELTQGATAALAWVKMAEAVYARMATQPTNSLPGLSEQLTQRAAEYRKKVDDLRREATGSTVALRPVGPVGPTDQLDDRFTRRMWDA